MANAVTDTNFENEVLKSDIPVLVDFWAEWCGPCKMLSPLIEDLTNTHVSKLKVLKLNIEENPSVPSTFGIRGIPTMMIFKNGELVDTKVGVLQKDALIKWIDSHI